MFSMPVPTSGESVRSSGTDCRCMFAPISARFASSFSRNGNERGGDGDELLRRDVDEVDLLLLDGDELAVCRAMTRSCTRLPSSSITTLACAMV